MKKVLLLSLVVALVLSLGSIAFAGKPTPPPVFDFKADFTWTPCYEDYVITGYTFVPSSYGPDCYSATWMIDDGEGKLVSVDTAECAYTVIPKIFDVTLNETCSDSQTCQVTVKGGKNHTSIAPWDQGCYDSYDASTYDSSLLVGGKDYNKNIPALSYVGVGYCSQETTCGEE